MNIFAEIISPMEVTKSQLYKPIFLIKNK